MESLTRFCEGRLQLEVNRAKSRAAPLKACEFLGYKLNNRAKLAWTEKARHRFKQRVREWERSGRRLPLGSREGVSAANQITSRNRGHRVKDVIDELNRYVRGWLNYYKHSSTYSEVKDLAEWVRRRVRLYLPSVARPSGCLSGRLPAPRFGSGSNGAGAKRRPPAAGQPNGRAEPGNQPRTRRRNLLKLGISVSKVHLATRSRKGYWRMSQNSIVRVALNNRWLEEQGVPDMKAIWTVLYYGPKARV